ncbi:hypothetical protein COU78_00690 [Candidatus Peregrinibacteria bacterium CG10_big_fil_rev_8_21_14_0_10_49_24]|nr:MAG: hypothetical protein COV83_00940 [Candidatus Peregrinibacteria bacterium CG11_big_fil_rev_8_21_14_0_20_49_14]PIR51471.1 MAG: hypothetical protein COU78_00690 [Candidatus Peregrinibacteria bacterium CG10_big_fil_rev_8_21_14_0_10_49_24]PJA67886.1 MAG: hypothetical protein CO157_02650 [Candidatus Peregrinibacteria bacterium CG_4_9_14_3_um_filter_49_12]
MAQTVTESKMRRMRFCQLYHCANSFLFCVRTSPFSANAAIMPSARDAESPGVQNTTDSSSTASCTGGISAQTIGLPAAKYSKSFSGEVSRWKYG